MKAVYGHYTIQTTNKRPRKKGVGNWLSEKPKIWPHTTTILTRIHKAHKKWGRSSKGWLRQFLSFLMSAHFGTLTQCSVQPTVSVLLTKINYFVVQMKIKYVFWKVTLHQRELPYTTHTRGQIKLYVNVKVSTCYKKLVLALAQEMRYLTVRTVYMAKQCLCPAGIF